MTILGAVGGIKSDVKFYYTVAERTSKEDVRDFFIHFLKQVKYTTPAFMITDNHSAHKSYLIREFLMQNERRLSLHFLPAYSSVLSPQERVWSQVKSLWSKNMSRITKQYNKANFKRDIELVCRDVAKKITPRIMHAADSYVAIVKRGELV